MRPFMDKLSREQELYLIDLGVKSLLEERFRQVNQASHARSHKKRIETKPKAKWTDEQRKKFSKTMAAKWKQKKAEAADK